MTLTQPIRTAADLERWDVLTYDCGDVGFTGLIPATR